MRDISASPQPSGSAERTPHAPQHRTLNQQGPTYTSQREIAYEADTSWMGDTGRSLHRTLTPDMDAFRDPDPPVVESGSLVESPSMTVGHGSVYQSSISDLLSRVCGSQMASEPVEELLAIYFAWQEPQHMPVDEVLFRRKYLKVPYADWHRRYEFQPHGSVLLDHAPACYTCSGIATPSII